MSEPTAAVTNPSASPLGNLSVIVGVLSLLLAAAPLAIWQEPPIWWRWMVPDSGPRPPSHTTLDVGWGPSTSEPEHATATAMPNKNRRFGWLSFGAQAVESPEAVAAYQQDRAAHDRRRATIGWFRTGSISTGVVGVLIGVFGLLREPRQNAARAGIALSAIGLTWDFVLLGVAVVVALFAIGTFFGALGAA